MSLTTDEIEQLTMEEIGKALKEVERLEKAQKSAENQFILVDNGSCLKRHLTTSSSDAAFKPNFQALKIKKCL